MKTRIRVSLNEFIMVALLLLFIAGVVAAMFFGGYYLVTQVIGKLPY